MARVSEWQRYNLLRSTIESALEEVGAEEDDFMVMAISPDLDEVEILLARDMEEGDMAEFIKEHEGWNIEAPTSMEDAIGIADFYFDLR